MAENDGGYGRPNGRSRTDLFSNDEIKTLEHELTALQDVIGAIRAFERLFVTTEPAWKRKNAVVEKLQKENRRVLESNARLQTAYQLWRDLRARTSAAQEARRVGEPT